MRARIGAVLYWIGILISFVGVGLNFLDLLSGYDLLASIINILISCLPYMVGWVLRWILTGRTDFGPFRPG